MTESTPFNLEQEAQYVLGLMDMYKHDFELENILRRKGLTDMQIVEVMDFVKEKHNQKRMRQGLRIMWMGIGIAAATGAAWAYFMGLFEGEFDADKLLDSFVTDSERPEGIFTMYLAYGFIFGVAQAILGAHRYIVYFKKNNS